MTRLRTAVIGVGHLGQHHARILSEFPDVELVGVVDANSDQAMTIAQRCRTRAFDRHEPLLDLVDAVSVVTPTSFHHHVAAEFLRNGIPVLVEKPMCKTVAEADELISLAREANVPLQVGHIERFNPAFEELAKRPIRPAFIEAERHGPYTGRSTDIGAVLDLMIHDLDLILSLVPGPVKDVSAVGAAVFGGHEDMVNARLVFESGCVAHVTASRISARPKRRLRIWASEGYAGIDFVSRKITLVQVNDEVRRHGLRVEKMDPTQRAKLKDEMFGRHLDVLNIDGDRKGDQLTNELRHFVDCVRANRTPRVTGEDGRDALALAHRVLDAVRSHAWDGNEDGPSVGPNRMPKPAGKLFELPKSQSEAA
ncbi:Gfo/Idh/MocA family protein [Fimbriiglobus ruber]|uniref:Oxidoreductase, Gfo/Idh/MocA family n=1 Tax=Fimbriiglobus ruber TaxID=1908690 RepID=A0A225E1S9_9BACT|nr:Gfo/Idh/MocA family oxidoreductase [Fimbriiglobus ruber]OWK43429.1 Oxidoreductase, Gfo/Idh/MocA family [Fimbriiglobus ruber]